MRFSSRTRNIVLAVLVALLAIFRLVNWKGGESEKDFKCAFENRKAASELVYTHHARCRMDCRSVNQSLVEQVYRQGEVNCDKSGPKEGDMRYALEMEDRKGDLIRLIVEDEADKHIVITVIRLDFEDRCECS